MVLANPRDLSSKLLHDLGDPAFNRGNDKEPPDNQRAIDLLSDENIGNIGVFLDEFHSLIDTDNQSVIFSTGEALKDIIIGSGSAFIAAGMPWSTIILETNRQLARRFKKIINIPFIDIRNDDDYEIFFNILEACDNYLPFKNNFCLLIKILLLRCLLPAQKNRRSFRYYKSGHLLKQFLITKKVLL